VSDFFSWRRDSLLYMVVKEDLYTFIGSLPYQALSESGRKKTDFASVFLLFSPELVALAGVRMPSSNASMLIPY
ncbi:hypothetical protein ACFEXU_003410, partial [Shigella flexneri]